MILIDIFSSNFRKAVELDGMKQTSVKRTLWIGNEKVLALDEGNK